MQNAHKKACFEHLKCLLILSQAVLCARQALDHCAADVQVLLRSCFSFDALWSSVKPKDAAPSHEVTQICIVLHGFRLSC